MSFWDDSLEPVALDRRGRVRRERAGLFVVVGIVLVLAVLAGGGYVAAYATAGDRVPRGTTVSGVAVGGMSREAAIAALQRAFAARAREPIVLAATDATGAARTVSIVPAEVGLSVDAAASVDRTDPRRSWRPTRIWDYFSNGAHLDAVATVDPVRLAARIRTMSGGFGAPPLNGRVVFTRQGARAVPGQAGDAVSLDAAEDALEAAYVTGARRAEIALTPAQPAIDRADVLDGLESFAQPAMSAPVVLRFGPRRLTLRPRQYAAALAMVPHDGRLVPRIRASVLLGLVRSARASTEPRDATVRLVGGAPRVVPGRPGLTFTDATILAAFRTALTAHGPRRTQVVAARRSQPAVTAAAVERLGVRVPVATFATYYPSSADNRTVAVAARLVDGRLLRPDQVLRVRRGSGPVATATFGAAFFAGLRDLTAAQPIVVDQNATGEVPAGLSFRNDSPYGVLVHVTATPAGHGRPGVVRVQLWSTKVWQISARKGAHTHPVSPPVRTEHGPGCRPRPGAAGYTVAVTRVFRKAGQSAVDHTETFHAVHPPVAAVVCR